MNKLHLSCLLTLLVLGSSMCSNGLQDQDRANEGSDSGTEAKASIYITGHLEGTIQPMYCSVDRKLFCAVTCQLGFVLQASLEERQS